MVLVGRCYGIVESSILINTLVNRFGYLML
jgi:hypothetical protein